MIDSALQSIELIPEQIKQAWKESTSLEYQPKFRAVKNIVIAGMGGSAYSYYVLQCLFDKSLTVPLILSNSYNLPSFVGKETLLIGSTYSGTTEETIQAVKEGINKGACVTAITAGGPLGDLLQEQHIPHYRFTPTHNPSGQPRMGQGYMVIGTLGILYNLGLLSFDSTVLSQIPFSFMKNLHDTAKELSNTLVNTIPIFVASGHLSGNVHILRNQTNETAKNYASYGLVPELNHHLMEGLKNPKDSKLHFLFFNSSLYESRIQKRMTLTQEVVEKNDLATSTYTLQANNAFLEFIELLIFGGYLTYYMAVNYGEDPNKIPWVDYFKKKLAS